MNRNLEELIRAYALGFNAEACLLGVSMATLKSMLIDLLTMYFNDLNSSTLREIVVALVSGYQPLTKKQGYNGYRYDALTGETEFCEIKPVNVRSDSTAKKPVKLKGAGNFTDFTAERLEGHIQKNPTMLTAGFVDGRLVYVCEFKFNEPGFIEALSKGVSSKGERRRGTFTRSADYDLRHYRDAASFEVKCYVPKEQLASYKKYLSRDMFNLLEGLAE